MRIASIYLFFFVSFAIPATLVVLPEPNNPAIGNSSMANSQPLRNPTTVRFLLLLSLPLLFFVADVHSAPCDYGNEKCGNLSIPYPFGMGPDCGLPEYRVSCKPNTSSNVPGFGAVPFLQLLTNDSTLVEYQVLNFSTYSLIINATDLKAASCDVTSPGSANFSIADSAPFLISPQNVFTVIGCRSTGNFTTSDRDADGSCTNDCYNSNSFPFCNGYACCTMGLNLYGAKSIQFIGAGIGYEAFPGVCGFSTVLDPKTYISEGFGKFGAGHYGLQLLWGLPLSDINENCTTVKNTPGYACDTLSECIDVGVHTKLPGYACACTLKGYRGDGYRNGSGCRNINECEEGLHNCVSRTLHGNCSDVPGSFHCSCTNGAHGDGVLLTSNGTGCTLDQPVMNNIAPLPATSLSRVFQATSLSTIVGVAFTSLIVIGNEHPNLFSWLF